MLGLFGFLASACYAHATSTDKPSLLLLKTYTLNQPVSGWVMSEKLDGVRAYWDGQKLISRNGTVFAVPDWFVADFPPFEIDGELWFKRSAFAEVVSIVNKHQPHKGWNRLTYQIFEVPNQAGGLLQRLGVLEAYLQKNPSRFIKVIPQVPIVSNQQVQAELNRIVQLGGEGVVLRNPNDDYHTGRSASSLKLKLKQDAECKVTGYTQGKGKYFGQVGALVCDIVSGQFTDLTQSARTIKVGSGLSDRERKVPPKIGRVITFQYLGLTKNGLPRFPVFLREKESAP